MCRMIYRAYRPSARAKLDGHAEGGAQRTRQRGWATKVQPGYRHRSGSPSGFMLSSRAWRRCIGAPAPPVERVKKNTVGKFPAPCHKGGGGRGRACVRTCSSNPAGACAGGGARPRRPAPPAPPLPPPPPPPPPRPPPPRRGSIACVSRATGLQSLSVDLLYSEGAGCNLVFHSGQSRGARRARPTHAQAGMQGGHPLTWPARRVIREGSRQDQRGRTVRLVHTHQQWW
jgi:hypothetical protein